MHPAEEVMLRRKEIEVKDCVSHNILKTILLPHRHWIGASEVH